MLPQRLEDMPEAPQQANKLPVSVLAHRATFVEAFRTCGVSTMPSSSDHTHDLAQTYGNSPTTEVAENASMTDHMPQGSRITRPTFLEGRRLFPATSSHDGMDHAEEETAVNPSSSATDPEVLSVPLFHRGPPRITYPDTIDVELPDDFVTDHDIQPKKYTVDRPQLERVWREQYVIEPSVGSNPNLLIRQDQAVLRSPTVTLRFFKAPPPLLRLPTELRLQILGYLLISFTPITNPYVDRHRGPEEKRPVFVDARILRTCRRIYIEGWPVLYQKNTFRFTEKAALDSFRSSKFWNHKEGLRHLELQTTVAERYCHRTVRIQGQMVQHMRVRGPAGWDWPFSPPWHFSHLHTLKLELKDFQLLPVMRPVRTRHFKPDPETKEGRDALLSRQAVIKHIEENCKMPKLQDLTVVGVPESMGLLLFEINLLMQTLFLIMGDNQHHRESVCYLEKRTGGRWERQDDKTILEWEILQQLLSIRREELAPSGHQRSERSEKYLAKLRRDLDLGVLAWIRRRNAKRLGDKAVAGKEPSPLW